MNNNERLILVILGHKRTLCITVHIAWCFDAPYVVVVVRLLVRSSSRGRCTYDDTYDLYVVIVAIDALYLHDTIDVHRFYIYIMHVQLETTYSAMPWHTLMCMSRPM